MKKLILFVLIAIIGFSCSTSNQKVSITYPFNDCVFPAEFPAPGFRWTTDSITENWEIDIEYNGKTYITGKSDTCKWIPNITDWEKLKKASFNNQVTCSVYCLDSDGNRQTKSSIDFTISSDSVGAPIFFRSVILPFSAANQHKDSLRWRLGSITSNQEPRLLLTNIPVCANCHSFPADGSKLSMDIDNANNKGSYTIANIHYNCDISLNDIITWDEYKAEDGENTFGMLSQISPDGKNVLSSVKDRSIFIPIDNNFAYSQLFFPIKGIIVNYNLETKQFTNIAGADDKNYVQSNPSWSADGKTIAFARAKKLSNSNLDTIKSMVIDPKYARDFLDGKKDFKFDLYHVPYNNGKGGEAKPLKGASNNGKSNFFAKYSPDGKWIVYCQADNYMLLRESSKLYMIPAQGGEARLMNCNTDEMNSWHSFSPNGKWLVYATKKMGPYTQLFLTHIDKNGNDSPPIWLEYFDTQNFAINIPEFVNVQYDKWTSITDHFSTESNYLQRAISEAVTFQNNYGTALKYLNTLIKTNPTKYSGYIQRGDLYVTLKDNRAKSDYEKGIDLINKELQKNPNDIKLIQTKVYTLSKLNKQQEALALCSNALTKNPQSYDLLKLKLMILLNQNKPDEVIKVCNTYLSKNPKSYEILFLRAKVLENTNQFEKAISDINSLLQIKKNDGELLLRRAFVYFKIKNFEKSLKDVNQVLSLGILHYSPYYLSAQNKYYLKDFKGAKADIQKALELAQKMINADPYVRSRKIEMEEFLKQINSAL